MNSFSLFPPVVWFHLYGTRNKFNYCHVHVGMSNKQANKHACHINCGRIVGGVGWWGLTRGRKPSAANAVTIFYTSTNNITSSLPGPSVNIKWSNLSFGQRRESDDSDVRLARPMYVYNVMDQFLCEYELACSYNTASRVSRPPARQPTTTIMICGRLSFQ